MLFFLTPLRPLAFLRAFSCFLALVLLSACGSVPVSSLWKLRQLQLDTLDPAALLSKITSPGRRTGFLNATLISTLAAGKCDWSAASARALSHRPWAMALGMPNSLALVALRWIGL